MKNKNVVTENTLLRGHWGHCLWPKSAFMCNSPKIFHAGAGASVATPWSNLAKLKVDP